MADEIEGQERLAVPVGENDHTQGPTDAPVTLVEYGDFECPYCGAAYPIIKEVQERLGDQLLFVFREFPLTQIHPHAQHAAEAAEAAGEQDKFWEMHDHLYEHQRALDDDHLAKYARAVGLDVDQFDKEMHAHKYADRVKHDFRGGIRSGVNGTPTLFINGIRYDGSWDADQLTEALEDSI